VPIFLPIPKLAAPSVSLKSALFRARGEREANRNLYGEIAEEWGRATDDQALYEVTEPKMRELLLGLDNKNASYNFETASAYAREKKFAMANLYLGYALEKIAGQLGKRKLGYGYDISGEVQEGGGTSGQGKHLWDTSNSPRNNHTQNNPSAMSMDAEAESDYPELAKFKRKRIHWPPRTR